MSSPSRIYALVVAAGVGARAGGETPKQYAAIGGRAMLGYSIRALLERPAVAGVQVVIHPDHAKLYAACVARLNLPPALAGRLLTPIHGGAERADSVALGLAALAPYTPDYVLIHDAARPFLSQPLLSQLIIELEPEAAVLPALAVADTVRRFTGGKWEEVSRKALMRMQTPQAFPFSALAQMMEGGIGASPTDEAALWLAAGGRLKYVAGDEDLRKVTTPEDIQWANRHVAATRRTAIGMGYDVHALMPSGSAGVIRLGGIDIENAHKLHGHSDADVVLHAVVDALLGSISAGDIGSFFPPTDARWKGANSAIFIEEARAQVVARGGEIQHLDITIIGEQPKISPHRDAMRQAIAQLLHLPLARVSVKATTTEKLGFTGREEGIACHAVATVSLPEGA